MNSATIDIVLPWVDGDDPVLKKRRQSYMNDGEEGRHEDVAGITRYKSVGEIKYCIATINLFAPFIRKIFIITDGQNPQLEPYLSKLFPEGYIPIEIVDHKTIFKGYEEYLPVFNSRGIETMMWRIPELSDRFILMNDDFFLIKPVTPEDFFIGEKTICYGEWFFTPWAKLLRKVKNFKRDQPAIGFKDSMINAVDIMGVDINKFLYLGHTPRALKKSFYRDFYQENENILRHNIRHKFRDASQFNSQEIFYISEYINGRCIQRSFKEKLLYLKPKARPNYINSKLKMFRKSSSAPFCCINSLSLASRKDQEKVIKWIEGIINQNLNPPV